MVTKHLKKSWMAYRKNFSELLKALIVNYGLFILIVVGGGFVSFFVPDMMLWIFGISIIAGVLLFIVLNGGFIRMCYESLRGKTKLSTMFKTSRKNAWPLIGTNSITFFISLIVVIVVSFAVLATTQPEYLFSGYYLSSIPTYSIILIYIIIVLILVLFSFVNQGVVINNLGVFKSIKKSLEVAKKNYLTIVYLIVIFIFFYYVSKYSIGLLPQVGPILENIVNYFLLVPLLDLCITNIYVRGKKK